MTAVCRNLHARVTVFCYMYRVAKKPVGFLSVVSRKLFILTE